MKFTLAWDRKAKDAYNALKLKAEASLRSRERSSKRRKATKDEGLFKQVRKCIQLLQQNPRHPGLQTHEYESMANPFDKDQKGFRSLRPAAHPRSVSCFLVLRSSKGRNNHNRNRTASLRPGAECVSGVKLVG